MKFEFINYWRGSSFDDGGVFPIIIFEIGGDIHPSYMIFGITILNFYFGISKKQKLDTVGLDELFQRQQGDT